MKENGNIMPMVWNEPGSDKHNPSSKDPSGSQSPKGPPDLEQLFRKLRNKLKLLFGNKEGNYKTYAPGFKKPLGLGGKEIKQGALWITVIFLLGYICSGFYIVEPQERAVITRFGAYIRTVSPGLHWLPWLIEGKEFVNVEQIQTSEHRGLILTRNKNIGFDIGFVEIVVYYQVVDPEAFLFNVIEPINTFKQVADSALRQVVGQSSLDEVLLTRAQIASSIQNQIKTSIEKYNIGLAVFDVVLKEAKAPDEVRAAFDDVIKAKEEAQRFINQAETYKNDIVPRANAKASRILAEAGAHAQKVQLLAEGHVESFSKMATQYQKSPRVTQTRLYIENMEAIFSKSPKVFIDAGNSNNMLYVPIDKFINSLKEAKNDNTNEGSP
jgi:membrane protease subunit HflK